MRKLCFVTRSCIPIWLDLRIPLAVRGLSAIYLRQSESHQGSLSEIDRRLLDGRANELMQLLQGVFLSHLIFRRLQAVHARTGLARRFFALWTSLLLSSSGLFRLAKSERT